ncbi:AT-hook DNA-binding motif-containing protein 1-like [Sinocyclocheilus rhinocerous]|uniref:AT-hook DNA-binding motif-containing protein 1-like n=1 Tax=Sinocyclocheilus rhinocerous TaxID=307959 RepID=UPI0007B9A9C1|nr:PREDICTED: AT-hook DNA-binding motif-containing protein 1-like [Sinocyclocheilus rhinocerous]
MSHLSGRLRSGGVRLTCEALADKDCSDDEGPSLWKGDEEPGGTSVGPTDSNPASSLHYSFYSPPSLANGLRNHEEQLRRRARRRRQTDYVEQLHTQEQMLIQQNTQPQRHTTQHSHSLTQSCTHLQPHTHIPMDTHMWMDTNMLTHKRTQKGMCTPTDTSSSLMEQDPSLIPEDLSLPSKTDTHNVHVQSAPLLHTTLSPNNLTPPQYTPSTLPKEETEHNSTCKPEMGHTSDLDHIHITGQASVMTSVEAERKYTLRSSGRPRFPCHLRKSSRLRRAAEENMFKREMDQKDEEEEENRVWRTEDIRPMEELPPEVCEAASSFEVLPSPAMPAGVTPNHSMRISEGESIVTHHSVRGRRQGRYLGVRKIVVKVARIPVHMSRRQKSYKISSLEPVCAGPRGEGVTTGEGPEAGVGGEPGPNVSREPTALLRMKNNGKSVMVMFPPGELPVILKRRRGRPPKQALPGQPDMHETRVGAASAAEPKKIRRRRTVKLPSPQPSYVNDTNDVKVEYADVLSKLAFLNRQPPSTGRCSPPRCWTPTEPETFHIPPENPSLSTLLHRLTGFRRRGGRAGCMGSRGGGAAGSSDSFKRSFSDFFETIGKKQKVPASEPGTPRKRGKGVAGGISRAALGDSAQGEKVRKRRSRKNGALKNGPGAQEQDWQNENSSWIRKGDRDISEKASSYQSPCFPRGSFQSSEASKAGMYHSPGMRGVGSGEESQGMFAGYFRSLLDSDDSSDLLDISMSSPAGRQEGRKLTPGYEGGSPGAAHRWSPAFPKRSPKGAACLREGTPLPSPQTQGSSTTKPSYSYSVSQTSPTTSFPKSPALLLSRSPSSPHPSGGYPQYPPCYSAGVPQGGSIYPLPQQQQQQQRPSDCSFTYGTKTPSVPSAQCQMSYSNYQGSAKRNYSGYPGPPLSTIQRGDSSATSPGGSYMSMSKSSPYSLSSSPPEGCRQYTSTAQWGYRQGGNNWGGDAYGTHQFHVFSEYGVVGTGSESKDILDISNYTPQKAKQRPCPDTLSESSSDSSHTGGGGMGVVGGAFRPRDVPMPEGQSSLSSLEKLMLDWNENSAGPSYNWSQNVLFQGGVKPGRGRRKKSETHNEKEACSVPPGSPASPPMQGGGPKHSTTGGRQPRGARGRGGFSPCQRDRPPPPKTKSQKPSAPSGSGQMGSGGVYQEALDYYSGDSSSLSPLSHAPESCEYPSPYSVHTSTPSSDERFAHVYPPDSASISPSLSNQSDALKQCPKPGPPSQTYGHAARTFSPTLSPTPRLLPQCGSAMSPHRVPKDQFSQYDSPSYSGSPCWFGQGGSVAGSPQNYEEQRPPAVSLPSNKRDMSLMVSGMRVPSHSSYPSPLQRGPSMSTSCVSGTLDSSPQHEEMGYHGNLDSYAPVGHRYAPQTARGGVLCQLLDPPSEEGFTVTSL